MLFTSSPGNSAWEDVVFVSRKDAKLAKKIQRRKAANPGALRTVRGLRNRSFRRDAKPAKERQKRKTPIQKPLEQPDLTCKGKSKIRSDSRSLSTSPNPNASPSSYCQMNLY